MKFRGRFFLRIMVIAHGPPWIGERSNRATSTEAATARGISRVGKVTR